MKNGLLIFVLGVAMTLSACQSDPEQLDATKDLSAIDYILIEKSKRTMSVFHKDNLLKQYNIALGKSPEGHKEKEGDFKTPEGIYTIAKKNPMSKYHRSLKISYPNRHDKANAEKKGHDPGGDIMIHGLEPHFWWVSPRHKLQDVTRGCIVVPNKEIEELFDATPINTKVEIKP
jgi:murein L,D-transpeptidase YafK